METNFIFYILNTAISVVVALIALRFLLQLTRVNFYNSICQGVDRFTQPLIAPFKSLPTLGTVNISVLISGFVIQMIGSGFCFFLLGTLPEITQLFTWSLLSVIGVCLNLIFYSMLGMIILSWLAPNASHPGAELLYQLSEPFLAPFRKLIPNLGGLDLSPILLFIVINILEATIVNGTAIKMGISSSMAQFFVGIG